MKYVFSGMSFLVRGECGIGSRSSHSVNRTEAHVTIFRVAQRVGKNAADLPIYTDFHPLWSVRGGVFVDLLCELIDLPLGGFEGSFPFRLHNKGPLHPQPLPTLPSISPFHNPHSGMGSAH